MTDPAPENPHDAAPPTDGFAAIAAGALGSLVDYLEARAELLRWEAREARSRLVRRLVAAAAALWLLFIAYALAVAALLAWLVESRDLSWPLAALSVAGGHLLLAAALFLFAKSGGVSRFFSDSLAELSRDREALRRKAEPRDPS